MKITLLVIFRIGNSKYKMVIEIGNFNDLILNSRF